MTINQTTTTTTKCRGKIRKMICAKNCNSINGLAGQKAKSEAFASFMHRYLINKEHFRTHQTINMIWMMMIIFSSSFVSNVCAWLFEIRQKQQKNNSNNNCSVSKQSNTRQMDFKIQYRKKTEHRKMISSYPKSHVITSKSPVEAPKNPACRYPNDIQQQRQIYRSETMVWCTILLVCEELKLPFFMSIGFTKLHLFSLSSFSVAIVLRAHFLRDEQTKHCDKQKKHTHILFLFCMGLGFFRLSYGAHHIFYVLAT